MWWRVERNGCLRDDAEEEREVGHAGTTILEPVSGFPFACLRLLT